MDYQAKSQNSAQYADMQAHFEEKNFFWEKWIIGQKSQNRARYTGAY